ncbi:LLM class F420-dependent oxidoreductase [Saccharothrix violaceirubra]|uniref:Putative F420-dependent oxidoreductase n=1 Tax=Saccharothrix violaceirubra TaxID=413306 RepID=A0A7W7WZI9_9PSEU|nr:TIGR03617 family F420-dependent LLM class oxidoreductase [Saccharothrix violaceirubra]MBB4968898.1 putative F420-dependent oxidoreductase [Saccharothrix violaceirubra]
MKIDQVAIEYDPRTLRASVMAGVDGFWVAETAHDPFVALSRVAGEVDVELGTAIAVAFARNPMSTAVQANDLQLLCEGRFHLGLGSQVEAHITKRFGMPWSKPAARMREFVQALQAIWTCWETGERLTFRGEFYRHTLMTPFFNPGPNPYGRPKIWLAGVGELMTEVAGEVADGFLCHALTTERYLREVTLPALARGRERAGRPMDIEISGPSLVVHDEASAREARERIAFYGSTPAYRKVLDLHGWGTLHEDLHRLSRRQQWADMAALIDDEILSAFAVIGTPSEVRTELEDRYGDIVSRVAAPSLADI